MNTNKKTTKMDMKAKLSTLWIFVLFNIIFSEFHRLLQPGFIGEVMTGTVNGTQLTQGVLLLGAVVLEIPIAMVILSQVLKYRVNRWVNIGVDPVPWTPWHYNGAWRFPCRRLPIHVSTENA